MKIKAGQKLYQIEGDRVNEVEVERVGTKFFYLKTDSSWRKDKIDKEHLETQFFLTEAEAKERLALRIAADKFQDTVGVFERMNQDKMMEHFSQSELEAFHTRFQAVFAKALNIGMVVGDRIQPWNSGVRRVNESGKTLEARVQDGEIVTVLEIVRYISPGALLKVQDDKGNTYYVLSRNFTRV